MCGLWRKDNGTLLLFSTRAQLASRLSQMFMLQCFARGHWKLVLHERRDDPLQTGLHEVSVHDSRVLMVRGVELIEKGCARLLMWPFTNAVRQ